MAQCVECSTTFDTDESPAVGEVIACPECGLEMKVTAVSPLALRALPPWISPESDYYDSPPDEIEPQGTTYVSGVLAAIGLIVVVFYLSSQLNC